MSAFAGKVALVTGASSGIGAALARELARQGASVALLARRVERLDAVKAQIEASGGTAVSIPCDVDRDGEIERAVAQTKETLGRIDVVVANAGFGVMGRLEDLSIDDYRRQFETNVFGLLRTAKAALAELKRTRGVLVLIGSALGRVSLPEASPYAMSKFAVSALADGLRGELERDGVSTVLITPGFVESEFRRVDNQGRFHPEVPEMMPASFLMPAEKAARQIVRAIRRRERERIVTPFAKGFVFLGRHFPRLSAWLGARLVAGGPQRPF